MDSPAPLLHEHECKNCHAKFQCSDPLCDGSLADPELCHECREVLKQIW
jgi:tRNA G26 N,N-dimethylase Trm1